VLEVMEDFEYLVSGFMKVDATIIIHKAGVVSALKRTLL